MQKHPHDQLMEMALSFLASRSFHTAVTLKVFNQLSGRALTLEETAYALNVPPFRLEKLLDICIGLGLLDRKEGRYVNSPIAEECLVEGKAGYIGHMMNYVDFLFYEKSTKLEEAVRQGQPLIVYEPLRRSDDEVSRLSTLAMEEMSFKVGKRLAQVIDLSGGKRLLDVGGGSGAITRALAEDAPGLEGVILDQPRVLKSAEELISSSPAASRLSTYVADYNQDPLPGGFDILILSNIIHINGINACRRMMGKAYGALNPAGQAVVIDFFLDDDKRGPLFANIFGMACAMLSPEGATYSRAEVQQWLEEAGFEGIQKIDLTGIAGCVIGRRRE